MGRAPFGHVDSLYCLALKARWAATCRGIGVGEGKKAPQLRDALTRAKAAKEYMGGERGGGEERKFAAKIGIVQGLGLSGE